MLKMIGKKIISILRSNFLFILTLWFHEKSIYFGILHRIMFVEELSCNVRIYNWYYMAVFTAKNEYLMKTGIVL